MVSLIFPVGSYTVNGGVMEFDTSGNIGKQVVGDDRGHVKTIIKMLAANNADYTPARVALAA